MKLSVFTQACKSAASKKKKQQSKIEFVMGEFKRGKLHSGSKKGPKVTSPDQAKAIALSEAKKAEDESETHGEANPVTDGSQPAADGKPATDGVRHSSTDPKSDDSSPLEVSRDEVPLDVLTGKLTEKNPEKEDTESDDVLDKEAAVRDAYFTGVFSEVMALCKEAGVDVERAIENARKVLQQ